jgi:hypothetical protein
LYSSFVINFGDNRESFRQDGWLYSSSQGVLFHPTKVVYETLRRPVGNSSVHLLPAACHHILHKHGRQESHDIVLATIALDQLNVIFHRGDVVLEWIIVPYF